MTMTASPSDAPPAAPTDPERVPWFLSTRVVMLFGLLLFSSSLRNGFFLDDFAQSLMVDGRFPVPRSPFDLYDFITPAEHRALADRGLLPWWTDETLQIRFFRPLGSALLSLDHRLFGNAAALFHLHSLAWWAATVLAVRALLSRTFAPRVVAVATAIFALAPCHALPLAWAANREALLAITFGVAGLILHRRHLDGGRALDAAGAAFAFLLSLLGGGEYALAFFGYVAAPLLFPGPESTARRVTGLAAFLLPATLYMIVRTKLGFATAGSGYYADPLRDPAMFLAAAPYRLVAQLSDAWFTIGSASFRTPAERWGLFAGLLTAAAIVAGPTRRVIVGLDVAPSREAKRLLIGSLIALAPTLAVVPATRLLGAAMVGVSLIAALVIDRAWFAPGDEANHDRALGFAALAFGFAHFVHGPGTSMLEGRHYRASATDFADRLAYVEKRVVETGRRDVVVLRASPVIFFARFALMDKGFDLTAWDVLSQSGRVLLLRNSERSIDLVASRTGTLYPQGERNLHRKGRPMHVGDSFKTTTGRITVLEVNDAGAWRVRVDFDKSPDQLLFLTDNLAEIVEVTLPPVGKGVPLE